ncbi:MAG: Isoprenylcysteine carboxyl methyltransferase (ICMT) family protein [Methanomassiliicoccales archaeon PtaB.Bin134]|nr:MAG: Isoprenylcysteine carboxyl methyltransferase (ICMT) family protein [Methanomassiliicoccales archaeon PtaB.Bin134]
MVSLPSLSQSPLVWAYLAMMFLFFFISLLYRGVRRDFRAMKGTRTEFVLFIVVNIAFIILPLAYALSPVFGYLDYHLAQPLSAMGLAGLSIALLIRAKAHLDLGDSFTISPGTNRKRLLITTGIYSRIRHPMYLSMVMWGIASPLVLQNYVIGAMPLVTIAIFLIVRMPLEESILVEEFGDEYRAYMARTGALLPRLTE